MEENLQTLLKNNKYRITPQRICVYKKLTPMPQTVEEIYTALTLTKSSIDIASVYRILTLFATLSIVHAVYFGDGKERYELHDPSNHHHHVMCTTCGIITDVSLEDSKKLELEAARKSNYQITSHLLEFFGICQNCRYA